MADREIHTHTRSGGSAGLLGVIIGAALVFLAIVVFFGGGWFGGHQPAGPQVTVNTPAPSDNAPAAPSGRAPAATPSGNTGNTAAPSGGAANQGG